MISKRRRTPPSTATFSVAIFPFLKTSAPVRIGDYVFRSTSDIGDLPEDQARAVTELSAMLYLRDDIRIANPSYAIVPPVGTLRPGPVVEALQRVRAVVGYVYSAPHPTIGDVFLSFDTASLAVLSPADVTVFLVRPEHGTILPKEPLQPQPDDFHNLPGYEGLLNGREPLWLAAGSRLYGPNPQMGLNDSQDLAHHLDEEGSYWRAGTHLLLKMLRQPLTPFGEKVFTALNWYNSASNKYGDSEESLLHLVIAFETLLELPIGDKTDRLIDSIALLLGRTERIREWAKQFYDARSAVAHQGRVKDWRFYTAGAPKKGDSPHVFGSVMTYGRQIFQICLVTLMTGANLAEEAGLAERFVANSERYIKIKESLGRASDASVQPADALAAIGPWVEELHRYQFQSGSTPIITILAAARAAAKALRACHLTMEDDLASALAGMEIRRADEFLNLEAMSVLMRALDETDLRLLGRPAETVAQLFEVAWHRLFMIYYSEKEHRDQKTDAEGDAESVQHNPSPRI